MLELPACAQVIDASLPWEPARPDPDVDLNGILWQTDPGFKSGEFSLMLEGDLIRGATRAGVKGSDAEVGTIAGPACAQEAVTPAPAATATLQPPVEAGEAYVVEDNNQVLRLACDDTAVTVTGNSNHLTLLGDCSSLEVRGNNNRIDLEAFTAVTDSGNDNVITMPEASPAATATPLLEETPEPDGEPVVVTDNNQELTIDCSGAPVTVNGNNNRLTLIGTCASLTIRGNANWLSLEAPPTAGITDSGNKNTVVYR